MVRGDLSRAHEAPMYLTAADGSIQEANPVLSSYSGRARRRAVVPLGYGRVLTTHTADPGPRERSVELTGVVRDAREILIRLKRIRTGKGLMDGARRVVVQYRVTCLQLLRGYGLYHLQPYCLSISLLWLMN